MAMDSTLSRKRKNSSIFEEELQEPIIDLKGFIRGDKEVIIEAADLIRKACLKHGFFQVINHGVDLDLITKTCENAKAFFALPNDVKVKVEFEPEFEPDNRTGYTVAHSYQYTSKLPWKEIITFGFPYVGSDSTAVDFFESKFGKKFQETGKVFQEYVEAMKKLSLVLFEILGISLGVDQTFFRKFYEDGGATVRANCYPICPEPRLTLGGGPHHDPTSLTILHQDQVGGLEVFLDGIWKSIRPRADAFVINIGDTFSTITNGMYKSCLHRVIVNENQERITLTFLVNSKDNKLVKPPIDVIEEDPRKFPDFTWAELRDYTLLEYRTDEATFENFIKWLQASKPTNPN